MHRDRETDANHRPVLGQPVTPEFLARIEEQLDEVRYREDGTPYTTRTWKSKKADEDSENQEQLERKVIPPPEVYATPITKGDERWPGGCTNITNLAKKCGWSWTATYSRGPRVHGGHGGLLGMSDYVLLRLRLDGSDARAVGFWVDTKFDHAWLARLDEKSRRYMIEGWANSQGLKDWIRGDDADA